MADIAAMWFRNGPQCSPVGESRNALQFYGPVVWYHIIWESSFIKSVYYESLFYQ